MNQINSNTYQMKIWNSDEQNTIQKLITVLNI